MLKPICLRHRLILEEISSPALDANKVMTPQDLLLACRILCTYDLKEMLAVKADWKDEKYYKHMLLEDSVYVREMEKFIQYLSFQDYAPVLWNKKEKSGNGRGVPSVLACISSLIRNGIQYEQAWTMPETEAVWIYVANAIAAGSDIDIVDEADKVAMEMLNKMEKPKKK